MTSLLLLAVVGTSIWVAVEASNLRARPGVLGGGLLDMGPVAWFFCCLLFWIVGFPAYLLTRPRYVAAARQLQFGQVGHAPHGYGPFGYHHGAAASPPQGAGPTQVTPNMAISVPGSSWAASPQPETTDPLLDQLTRLSQLRHSGALTQAEFETLKARLLGQ